MLLKILDVLVTANSSHPGRAEQAVERARHPSTALGRASLRKVCMVLALPKPAIPVPGCLKLRCNYRQFVIQKANRALFADLASFGQSRSRNVLEYKRWGGDIAAAPPCEDADQREERKLTGIGLRGRAQSAKSPIPTVTTPSSVRHRPAVPSPSGSPVETAKLNKVYPEAWLRDGICPDIDRRPTDQHRNRLARLFHSRSSGSGSVLIRCDFWWHRHSSNATRREPTDYPIRAKDAVAAGIGRWPTAERCGRSTSPSAAAGFS
jgi:hypothetical protein